MEKNTSCENQHITFGQQLSVQVYGVLRESKVQLEFLTIV